MYIQDGFIDKDDLINDFETLLSTKPNVNSSQSWARIYHFGMKGSNKGFGPNGSTKNIICHADLELIICSGNISFKPLILPSNQMHLRLSSRRSKYLWNKGRTEKKYLCNLIVGKVHSLNLIIKPSRIISHFSKRNTLENAFEMRYSFFWRIFWKNNVKYLFVKLKSNYYLFPTLPP